MGFCLYCTLLCESIAGKNSLLNIPSALDVITTPHDSINFVNSIEFSAERNKYIK